MSDALDLARLRRQDTDDAGVEIKASAKRLSTDIWDSVSAFANTAGASSCSGRVLDDLIERRADSRALRGARNRALVDDVLRAGNARADVLAEATLTEVRDVMGMGYANA